MMEVKSLMAELKRKYVVVDDEVDKVPTHLSAAARCIREKHFYELVDDKNLVCFLGVSATQLAFIKAMQHEGIGIDAAVVADPEKLVLKGYVWFKDAMVPLTQETEHGPVAVYIPEPPVHPGRYRRADWESRDAYDAELARFRAAQNAYEFTKERAYGIYSQQVKLLFDKFNNHPKPVMFLSLGPFVAAGFHKQIDKIFGQGQAALVAAAQTLLRHDTGGLPPLAGDGRSPVLQ